MNTTKVLYASAAVLLSGVIGYQLGSKGKSHSLPENDPSASAHTSAMGDHIAVPIDSIRSLSETENRTNPLSLQAILSVKDWAERYSLTLDYIDKMTKENVDQYLADLEELPPSIKKTQIMGAFFAKWGELEGRTAYDFAMSIKGRDRSQFLSLAVSGWAKLEPLKAWDAVMEATANGKNRTVSYHSVLSAIAESDLKTAVKLANRIESNGAVRTVNGVASSSVGMSSLVRVVSQSGNFAELSKVLMEESDPKVLGASLDTLFGAWGKYEFDGPLVAIKEIKDPDLAKQAMTGFMKGWAQADGGEAFQYAIENQSDAAITAALPDIASLWIQSATPDEMAGIVSRLSEVENRDDVASKLIWPVSRTNPQLGMDLAIGLEDPKKREQSVRSAAMNWVGQDIEKAEAYIRSIPDEKLRLTASGMLVSQQITQGGAPEKVLSLVDGYSDEKSRQSMLGSIMASATRDTNKAKSKPLIDALKASVETRPDISEEFRKKILEAMSKD